MRRAIKRPTGSFDFTLPDEAHLQPEERTTFVCRPLTQEERFQVMDEGQLAERAPDGTVTVRRRAWQQARDLFLSHVEDVRNVADAPGPWPRATPAMPADSDELHDARVKWLDCLEEGDVALVGFEIKNRSILGPDAGNSSPGRRTSDSPAPSPAPDNSASTTAPAAPPTPG